MGVCVRDYHALLSSIQGCNDTLVAFLQANALIIGACGVVIGVVEVSHRHGEKKNHFRDLGWFTPGCNEWLVCLFIDCRRGSILYPMLLPAVQWQKKSWNILMRNALFSFFFFLLLALHSLSHQNRIKTLIIYIYYNPYMLNMMYISHICLSRYFTFNCCNNGAIN